MVTLLCANLSCAQALCQCVAGRVRRQGNQWKNGLAGKFKRKEAMGMETFYTPEEVAEILKVRKHTVWNWLREGSLKGTKINGKIWRITADELEAFIRSDGSEKEQ